MKDFFAVVSVIVGFIVLCLALRSLDQRVFKLEHPQAATVTCGQSDAPRIEGKP